LGGSLIHPGVVARIDVDDELVLWIDARALHGHRSVILETCPAVLAVPGFRDRGAVGELDAHVDRQPRAAVPLDGDLRVPALLALSGGAGDRDRRAALRAVSETLRLRPGLVLHADRVVAQLAR